MSALPPAVGHARRLPDVLAEAAALMRRWYPDYRFALVGKAPDDDPAKELRVPCPGAMAAVEDIPEMAAIEPIAESGLDGLLVVIAAVMRRRFPDADHACLMVERHDLPATVIPVRF